MHGETTVGPVDTNGKSRRYAPGDTKICRGCGLSKPFEEFGRKGAWTGRRSRCKACERLRDRTRERARDPLRKRCQRVGITPEKYQLILDGQGRRCAICYTTSPSPVRGGHRTWHIDHDHVTGSVRGILCGPCNTAIGLMRDDTERLARAIGYLNKNSSR